MDSQPLKHMTQHAEKYLMLLPLGLGLRFPRLPILTLILAFGLVCLFIVDLPTSRYASKRSQEIVETPDYFKVRQALLLEYCRYHGGSALACGELDNQINERMKTAKEKKAAATTKPAEKSAKHDKSVEILKEYFTLLPKLQDLEEHLTAKDEVARGLKSFPKYETIAEKAKAELTELHKKYDLLSASNPSPKAFMLAQFRHSGWLHLIGNLFALIAFGAYVELRMGPMVYLLTYMLGGVLGIGLYTLTSSSSVHLVGASANISAVMGAFFVAFLQYRMKFVVVTLLGVRTFFGQVAVFFPVIYILSECLSMFEASSGAFGGGVANGAHLIGLGIGMIVGAVDRKTTRIRWPFIYPDEAGNTLALQKINDIDLKIKGAERLLKFNPENVYARFLVLGDICYAGGPMTSEAAQFLGQHMSPCATIQIRKGKAGAINEMLDALAIEAPFPRILGTLDSKNILTLADKALDDDNLLLALRLFDCFAQRFPRTRMATAVRKTMSEILQHVKADDAMKAYIKRYLTVHPTHKLPIAVGRPPTAVVSPPGGKPNVA